MAGQNRSSYARSNSGVNRGLAAFFRGAFILLVALTLSFGLGFFVIARMLPPSVTEGSGGNGGAPKLQAPGTYHPANTSQKSGAQVTSAQLAAKPTQSKEQAQDGPVILPETGVQKPDRVGTTSTDSHTSASTETGTADTNIHAGAKSENETATPTNPGSGIDPTDSSSRKHTRRSRSTPGEGGAVQPAASPDATGTTPVDSNGAATANTSSSVKPGVYRVQIGVYSTREKAEEAARSAGDKGIVTTLHVVTRDGRTLYRVQQSTHRDRARAERDRQKLLDAGFDATIINPSE